MSDKVWISNAKWTEIPDSKDYHNTEEDAIAVCNMLMKDYGIKEGNPCSIRGNCVDTWVNKKV